MTEAQGDTLGSICVLISTGFLLWAVHLSSVSGHERAVRYLMVLSVVLSVSGVATVIYT